MASAVSINNYGNMSSSTLDEVTINNLSYGSLLFNGTSQYLTWNPTSSVAFSTNDFIVEGWFKLNENQSSQYLVDFRNSGQTTAPALYFSSSKLTWYNGSLDLCQDSSTTRFNDNAWHHVAYVRIYELAQSYLYVDGVLVNSIVDTTNYSISPTTSYIGAKYSLTASNYWNGYISNFRIVNGTALYNTGFTPSQTPLLPVAGTTVLVCQSNKLIEPSNNNLTFTKNGKIITYAFGPFVTVRESTPITYSTYHDGNGDYLSVAHNTALDLAGSGGTTAPFTGAPSFTVECWFYCTALTAADQEIFNKDGTAGSSYSQYCFRITSAGLLKFVVGHGENASTGNGSEQTFTISNSITLNTWYHIAACQATPNQIYTFLNGTLIAQTTRTQYMADGGKPLLVGYQTGQASTQYFNGYISNLRVIKGTALYTASFTPSTTPLTAITNTSLLTCQSTTMSDNSTNAIVITGNGDTKPKRFNPFGYTASTVTSYVPSTHGGSMYLDGSGDYLSYTAPLSFTGAFTVQCWIYNTSTSGSQQTIFSFNSASGNGYGSLRVDCDSNGNTQFNITVSLGTSGAAWASTLSVNSAYAKNNWSHIAVTRDSANLVRLFVNGVQITSGSQAGTLYSTSTTHAIGCNNLPGAAPNAFQGYISDLQLINGVAIYVANFVPPTQALTNYYSTRIPANLLLNFTDGGIVDAHSSVVAESVGNAQLSTAIRKYGNSSIYFDGSGDYLIIPPNIGFVFGTGDFTIECWFYIVSGSAGTLFDTRSGATGVTPLLWFSSSLLRYYINGGDVILSATTLSASTWYHVALARSSGVSKMFLNGVQTGSTYTDSNNFTLNNAINIGRGNDNANVFNGYIDDLRITKGYARYTANFTPFSLTMVTL
jgi:hypothetical protein